MNIPELKMDLEVIKLMIKSYEERGGGYSQKVALQNVLSTCQLLCDVSDKMEPKKDWIEEFDKKFIGELQYQAGDCDIGFIDAGEEGIEKVKEFIQNKIDLARSEDILWISKKMMGLEEIIENNGKFMHGVANDPQGKEVTNYYRVNPEKVADAIRQEMGGGE